MRLKLPMFGSAMNTLGRWATIFTSNDFVVNQQNENLKPFDCLVTGLAGSAMTIVKDKQDLCGYCDKLTPWIYVDIRLILTLGGVADNAIFLKLPLAPFNYPNIPLTQTIGPSFSCVLSDGGVYRNGIAAVRSLSSTGGADNVIIAKEGSVNFTIGQVQVLLSGWYRRQT